MIYSIFQNPILVSLAYFHKKELYEQFLIHFFFIFRFITNINKFNNFFTVLMNKQVEDPSTK